MATSGELLKSIMENDPERAQAFLKNRNPYEVRNAYGDELNNFLLDNYDSKSLSSKNIKDLFLKRENLITSNVKIVKPKISTPEQFIPQNKQDYMTKNFGKNVNGAYEASEFDGHPGKIYIRPDTSLATTLHEYGHDNDLRNKGFESKQTSYSPDVLRENKYRPSLNDGTSRFLNDLPEDVRNKLLQDKWSGVNSPEKALAEAATPSGIQEIHQARKAGMARAKFITGAEGADKYWEGHHERGIFEKEALGDLATKGQIGAATTEALVGAALPIAVHYANQATHGEFNPLDIKSAGEGSEVEANHEQPYGSVQELYRQKKLDSLKQ